MALFQDDYYLVGKSGLTVHLDYTAWGWIHLIGGIIVVAAGVALFVGQTWARNCSARFWRESRRKDFS